MRERVTAELRQVIRNYGPHVITVLQQKVEFWGSDEGGDGEMHDYHSHDEWRDIPFATETEEELLCNQPKKSRRSSKR